MKQKIISLLLVICMGVAVISGCGTSQTDTSKNISSEETAKESNTTEDTITGSSDDTTGGILKIGTGQSPSVVGYTPEITNNSYIQFLRTAFDSLIFYDEEGNLIPDLAESWEVDAENAKITFYLRSGVQFQDGTEFNADAVKWNIEQYQAAGRTEVNDIASIECTDENTVVITLNEWRSSAVESIGFFIYYMSPTAVEENGIEWARVNSVGTGPFKVSSFEQGVSIKYEKNEDYWEEGKPYLDGIEYTVIADATTLQNTLVAGEIDMIAYANVEMVKVLEPTGDYTIEENQNGVGVESVGVIPSSANEDSPFYDPRVRKAFCYAIDADTIVEALGYGYLNRTNQWAAPGASTYNTELEGYTYNIEKAKELLAEAGYANGFDTTFWAPAVFENWATAIADNLTAVGIRTQVEIIDGAKTNDLMTNGWKGIIFHFASIGPDLGLYMGRHLDPSGAYYAPGIQHPDELVELLQKIRQAKDDKSKLDFSWELQKKVYDEYALFGLPLNVNYIVDIKKPYVMDDNYAKYHVAAWTPENAWLNK